MAVAWGDPAAMIIAATSDSMKTRRLEQPHHVAIDSTVGSRTMAVPGLVPHRAQVHQTSRSLRCHAYLVRTSIHAARRNRRILPFKATRL